MIEWPTATPIDLDTYPRRQWYEHFCSFEIPISYRTVQIDVTDLKAYCKYKGVKFSQTLSFILTRACNHVPEYRHRIEDEKPVCFDKIIPVFTVLMPNKVFQMIHGVFTDNFASDYERNLEIQDRTIHGLEGMQKTANQGVVFVTTNPWTTHTAVQAPYTKRFASVPVFCVGKMYEDGGRIKLGLGMQVHHGLVDGYHMGHVVHILERHLEDPMLIEGPFVSTFE